VPIRGEAYGSECLSAVLGPDAPSDEPAPAPAIDRAMRWIAGVGFGVALLGTALPWSRFGVGSDRFGAWGQDLRWSLVVATSSVLGVTWWLAVLRMRERPRADELAIALAGLVILATLLAIWRPPPFTRTWLGPWVSGVGGLIALAGALGTAWILRRRARIGEPERS
jgi:hypothetical protein